jgi:hypothetical protein
LNREMPKQTRSLDLIENLFQSCGVPDCPTLA